MRTIKCGEKRGRGERREAEGPMRRGDFEGSSTEISERKMFLKI